MTGVIAVDPEKERADIEAGNAADLREIAESLMDIRRRTGYGSIVIDIRGGEIIEITLSIKRRPKVEQKTYGLKTPKPTDDIIK